MTQVVNTAESNQVEYNRKAANAINALNLGRIASVGIFSMLNATTTTTITDPNIHSTTVPLIVPLSATSPTFYVSSRTAGSLVITHANPGATKNFAYALFG